MTYDKVEIWVQRVSKQAMAYYLNQASILRSYMIVPAKFENTLDWSMSLLTHENVFPTEAFFKEQIQFTEGIQLKRINYKVDARRSKLSAI